MRTARAIMFVAALTIWLTTIFCATAQEAAPSKFKIQDLKLYWSKPPDYGGSGGNLGAKVPAANKTWARIEVEFSCDLEWADDVQVKYYVLMGKGRDAKLFAGELNHNNVPKGSRHFSGMFLHPSTVQRFGQGSVERIAALLFYQNRLIATRSEPSSRDRWWEQLTPTPGFLMPPSKTPWSVVAHEHFLPEKANP